MKRLSPALRILLLGQILTTCIRHYIRGKFRRNNQTRPNEANILVRCIRFSRAFASVAIFYVFLSFLLIYIFVDATSRSQLEEYVWGAYAVILSTDFRGLKSFKTFDGVQLLLLWAWMLESVVEGWYRDMWMMWPNLALLLGTIAIAAIASTIRGAEVVDNTKNSYEAGLSLQRKIIRLTGIARARLLRAS